MGYCGKLKIHRGYLSGSQRSQRVGVSAD